MVVYIFPSTFLGAKSSVTEEGGCRGFQIQQSMSLSDHDPIYVETTCDESEKERMKLFVAPTKVESLAQLEERKMILDGYFPVQKQGGASEHNYSFSLTSGKVQIELPHGFVILQQQGEIDGIKFSFSN